MTKKQFFTVVIVVFMVICGFFGIDLHLAAMPTIQVYFHTSQAEMQHSVSLYLLGTGISLLFYGPLSDRFGRKPVVIFGLTLSAMACFASVASSTISVFLLTRFLQGFGAGACAGVGRAILGDLFNREQLSRITSYTGSVVALSPLLAPVLGGYLLRWHGWQMIFIILGVMFAIAMLSFMFICPESNQHKNPNAINLRGLLHAYAYVVKERLFTGATLITGITMAAVVAYTTIGAFLLQKGYHLSAVEYGWITSLTGAGVIVGRLCSRLTVRSFGMTGTIVISQFFILFAGLLLLSFMLFGRYPVSVLIIAVFLTVFSQAMAQSNTTSLALSLFQTKRGVASTVYGGFQQVAAFLCSALIASININGFVLLMSFYLILGAGGILVSTKLIGAKQT